MENGEQRYPNREQLEAGMEIAATIGQGRTTRFRQMLNMLDDLEQARDLVRRMAAKLNEWETDWVDEWGAPDDDIDPYSAALLAEAEAMTKEGKP